MFKVLSNLKESALSVIAIILLLIVQANVDLALPDYTSKIVNVGIQQSGIESAAPEVIRESEMENILLFTSNDEKILKEYDLIDRNSVSKSKYTEYYAKYPIIDSENIYVRKNLTKEEIAELEEIISNPMMIYSMITSEQYAETMKEQMLTNAPEEQKQVMDDIKSHFNLMKGRQEQKSRENLVDCNVINLQLNYNKL